MWTLYQGISWTLPLILTPQHWTKLRISQLVQCAPASSNCPCGKNWVRCIHRDGRPYPNLCRIRWHSMFKAKMFHYQYQWINSSICCLRLSNCKEATSPCSRPHGIPDSDSGSQWWILQWLLVEVWLMFLATATSQSNYKWSDMDST